MFRSILLYRYCQLHPQKEYTIDRYNPTLPDEAITKISLMNLIRLDLGIGLIFLILFFYCDFRANPSNSWLKPFIDLIKEIKEESK